MFAILVWVGARAFAPPCAAAISPLRTLPRGVQSVVHAFGADPTGARDSTAALQKAVTAAMRNNVTLFIPFGCYTVTQTISAVEPRNGRWQPIVIVGEEPRSNADNPPALVLAPSTTGFTDAKTPTPVLLFVTNWCLAPGLDEGVAAAGCASPQLDRGVWESSAYQFNQALVGVDIFIGAGNLGAVGIDMNGAQGSTLENVAVYAGADALAGVAGGNGGGGSFKGVMVVGAKVGIDMRETGDAATYVTITLLNQTCAGILQGSHSTCIVTGLDLRGAPLLGGVIAGIDAAAFGVAACVTPPAPYANLQRGPGEAPAAALRSSLSLVDSTINVSGGAPCVLANSSLYLSTVFTAGCAVAVQSGGRAPTRAVPSASGFTHFDVLAYGRGSTRGGVGGGPGSAGDSVDRPGAAWTYAFPTYVDGARSVAGICNITSGDAQPPLGLHARHLWSGTGTTWQHRGAISALALGARGDGVTDDWSALQAAVNAHDVVYLPKGLSIVVVPLVWLFRLSMWCSLCCVLILCSFSSFCSPPPFDLPKGFYRLSRPLVLKRGGGALVGVGRTLSFLMPLSEGFAPATQASGAFSGTDARRGSAPGALEGVAAVEPVLRVEASDVTVAFLTIATWDHLSNYAFHWSSASGNSVYRQVFFNRVSEGAFPPFSATDAPRPSPSLRAGTRFARPLSVISGGGAFYDFNLDFGCCFGTVIPPWTSAPPDISSSEEILLQEPLYRTVLVNGSQNYGVRFYPLNAEQDFGEAHAEVRWSSNVTAYGSKSENNFLVLWVRDSDRVTVHGYGGNASPFANSSAYRAGWIGGPTGYAQFMPSLFRVQRCVQ